MMHGLSLFVALLLLSFLANAQQPIDPALATCRQLRDEANNRVEHFSVQATKLSEQVQTLAKQLEDAKAELAKSKQ